MGEGFATESTFVGRSTELTSLAACVHAAAAGQAGVVWIEGEAGTGKSALVRQAVATLSSGFHVLRAEADELAHDLAFAVVSQLGPVTTAGAFAAGLDLVQQWSELQDSGPIMVVVEDLHWADPASRQALATAARRLGEDRVVMLVTTRPGGPPDDGWERLSRDPDRTRRVVLGSLSHVEVAELARRAGIRLSRRQTDRLRRHTGGHPLYVRTLLTELDPSQLTAEGGDLPAPRSLSSATVTTLAKLPGPSRDLVSALAVLNRPTPLLVAARVASVADAAAALEPLLDTGFVRWRPTEEHTPVEFTHPLYRSAVYNDLSPTRRRDLHLAAAATLTWGLAWAHRVAAADGVDDALADELDAGARYELARDDLGLAAKYLAWAARLTSSTERSEARVLEAARLLLIDRQSASAAALRPQIEACSRTPLRDLVFGTLAFSVGDMTTAEHFLGGMADFDDVRDVAPRELADALSQLSTIFVMKGRPVEALEVATSAMALDTDEPFVDRRRWAALAHSTAWRHGPDAGAAVLAGRLPAAALDADAADGDLLATRGTLEMLAGRYSAAIDDLRAAIGLANRGFSPSQLPRAHLHLAQVLVFTGEWDESLAHAHITQSLADDDGRVWMRAQAEGTIAQVLASRGEWGAAGEHVALVQASALALGTTETVLLARLAEAALARALGQPAGVVAALRKLARDGEDRDMGTNAVRIWAPPLIAALVELGELQVAQRHLDELEGTNEAWGLRIEGQLAGLRARLAAAHDQPSAALAAFADAVALIGPDDPMLDRALLHHEHGRALLRAGDRKRAREELRTARDLLAGLGAEPYVQRVDHDLVATGVQANTRSSRSPLSLTDRERDIVALVRKGMTNREVAAQIYVSEKAVEYHLRNVFGKLGISSRRELRVAD